MKIYHVTYKGRDYVLDAEAVERLVFSRIWRHPTFRLKEFVGWVTAGDFSSHLTRAQIEFAVKDDQIRFL